jgi:hypothetical protein
MFVFLYFSRFSGIFMKKLIFLLAFLFLSSYTFSFAQKQNPAPQTQPGAASQAQPKVVILKPVFELADVIFALNAIGTVEIQGGTEVDAFLVCKKALTQIVESAQASGKKPNDKISADIQLPVAQNILTLLNRAKFTGAFAGNYKGFVDSLVASARPYQQQNQVQQGK